MSAIGGQSAHYHAASKWLHWLVALIVLSMIPIGLIMVRMKEGLQQDNLFWLHESFGILMLMLVILRLAVRFSIGVPGPSPALTTFEIKVSRAAHTALYVLLFLLAALGWSGVCAFGAKASFFGLFELPCILDKNEHLAKTIFSVHLTAALLLAAIVAVHVAGAFRHGTGSGSVLTRMLPGRR